MSLAKKGKIPKNLAWLHEHAKGQIRPSMHGEKHWLWKGSLAGYSSLHKWIVRHRGRALLCMWCMSVVRVQWANISHQYKRDLDDWMELCNKCHASYDMAYRKGGGSRRSF